MKENKRASVWVYAVVLFTSAFIILLFAAISQIRINNDLDEYKSKVDSKETENNLVHENFLSAQEMNKRLNEKIDELDKNNQALKNENENLNSEIKNLDAKVIKRDESFETLIQALSAYQKGDEVGCAALIKKIDTAAINEEQVQIYNEIALEVYSEAGKKLFNEGYYLYKEAQYKEAIKNLLLSYEYAPRDVFSDKCLYYLAYSQMRADMTDEAVKHMNILIRDYPSSKYIKYAKDFIERYGRP